MESGAAAALRMGMRRWPLLDYMRCNRSVGVRQMADGLWRTFLSVIRRLGEFLPGPVRGFIEEVPRAQGVEGVRIMSEREDSAGACGA